MRGSVASWYSRERGFNPSVWVTTPSYLILPNSCFWPTGLSLVQQTLPDYLFRTLGYRDLDLDLISLAFLN